MEAYANTDDALSHVSETPDLAALNEEYQNAWNQDKDALSRIARSEDIRYTRWPGQSADGLKHQELQPEGIRAMPYDRAPDTRINLADGIIQELVDRDYAAFWNARVKTAPASASRLTAGQSAEWRILLSWMIHGPLRAELVDKVEFASQVLRTVGWVVLHPTWRRKTQLRRRKLSLDSILQLAAKAPPETVLAELPAMVQDPEQEEAAAEVLRMFFPSLKEARARRVIRELRAEGEAEFAAPDQVENVPELSVLVPWQDFIMPVEATAQPGTARAMFRRKFMSEAEVDELAAEEDWNEEFVAAVKKTRGMAMENGTSQEHAEDENMVLIEVVWGYTRGVDEDGVPGLYCTTFSPHLQARQPNPEDRGLYGKHELVDLAHGQYPFIFLTTEVIGRRPMDARGVPDVVATQQQEIKQQRDASYVYSQLSVTPPLQKRGTQASKLPPELGPLGIINNVGGGEWSWFPPPPGNPQIAFTLEETVRREAEDYHGIARADLPPARWQPRQQRQTMRWLAKWGEAFWQLSVLAYQYLSPEEMQAVIGHAPSLTADQVARHALLFWFDIRALDPSWVESLLKSITELILPADAAGVVDRSKLVQFAMAYLDPTLAEELTTDQAGAKQAVFKGVRDEIASIMQGNEGLYVENDPTAKAKLMFARQVIGNNPDYQAELVEQSPHFNPRKRVLLEKWMKNLGQSAAQQDNKMVGRLGVKPGPETGQAQGASQPY